MSHAHEHHHDDATGKPNELATCPVMGVVVNKHEAQEKGLVRTVGGKTYYLCCNTCAQQFDAYPEKYTDGD